MTTRYAHAVVGVNGTTSNPHRVLPREWGLTLCFDRKGGTERVHVPWHRIDRWTERPTQDPGFNYRPELLQQLKGHDRPVELAPVHPYTR